MLNKGRMHHLKQRLIIHILPNGPGNLLQLLKANPLDPPPIIQLKNPPQPIPRPILPNPPTHTINKLFEIDGFVLLSY
jgi:hypothetical protein